MTTNKNENQPKNRDYKHEYQLRQKRNKRIHADMDRAKVEAFQNLLNARGQTFVKWLDEQIERELKNSPSYSSD